MERQQQELISQAVSLAEKWQNRANRIRTRQEKCLQAQLQRLLDHPHDKVLLSQLIDQSFRAAHPHRIADQMQTLLREYGVPEFLRLIERGLLRIFTNLNPRLLAPLMPLLVEQMRKQSARLIIAGETAPLHQHLRKRRLENVRININHLGEAVLGEEEATHRLTTYIADLKDRDIEHISIKISTLYSQISSLAFDQTIELLKERLSILYRVAQEHSFQRAGGEQVAKFINLDMEEYRDLDITYQVFVETLSEQEFEHCSAGIVLQAYLPDSFAIQQQLTQWARARVATGGAPIKLRIVKGANMEMEKLESSVNNWPLAPFDTKVAVDANYKRMVEYGMRLENIQAVNLGIASHNLFELAYAATVARERQVTPYFCFEMLEGMADHIRRALQEDASDILLYAPVAGKSEFINAIAYLIRRLDENTAAENFLRYAPELEVGSHQWTMLKEGFLRSCARQERLSSRSHRQQDRNTETFPRSVSPFISNTFKNEPDTDWSLAANRHWAESIRTRWYKTSTDEPLQVPVVVNGQEIFAGRATTPCKDPNQRDITVALSARASQEDAEQALQTAAEDADGWRVKTHDQRHELLARAAMEIRLSRGDLIGAAAASTGKVFTEADPEVSEAIDFTEFYPLAVRQYGQLPNLQVKGRGVVLVLAPWNFPIAIPCGGIAAALAAGNTVIFKPASDAVLCGWILCQCFWRAGISKKTLQFVPGSGSEIGPRLTTSPLVNNVILTGGTETGLQILQQAPGVYLAAETGGKNATIVTEMADRDLAIKNLLHSAFSNCGQKCSATSLLILETHVYRDQQFKRQLVDAAQSLGVGSAWDFSSKIGPLIRPPDGDLLRALTSLEPGEEWALQPKELKDNPLCWTPGIKYGIQPGSSTHLTEFFGPLLGVMEANNLDEAIQLANLSGYGLTSGLESLDEREQRKWKEKIFAGNLYINRGTTGAVVLRQPFGGFGKSSLGSGIKAGSPEYVSQFMEIQELSPPPLAPRQSSHRIPGLLQEWRLLAKEDLGAELHTDMDKLLAAVTSYAQQMETYFGVMHDYFHLRGQDNLIRFLPVIGLIIRIEAKDSIFETLARIAAATFAGCEPVVSMDPSLHSSAQQFLESHKGGEYLGQNVLVREDEETLAGRIGLNDRIRFAGPVAGSQRLLQAAAKKGVTLLRSPVYMEGRLELIQYMRQQAICCNYHRYGNLGKRAQDMP
ncbi:proline dehydrogenase family protein [Desulfobulbus rhabdoformis]|uniref:proline dehydrogenase family protein n=1 Tax=Desulfobulbus rhabdoformis TaxID=34032 RepID=UPI00196578D5|nr:bifunctional proline dehydrogenase/L-glutamate gamma-semialdehyde dehydrogenase [Desulfobulbus rhabdoformis]MBM9613192.1 proline dehydrogenase family protein [Desulfobulbus rhabdoformis]